MLPEKEMSVILFVLLTFDLSSVYTNKILILSNISIAIIMLPLRWRYLNRKVMHLTDRSVKRDNF